MKRGGFIVFEGIDGAGKTTQIHLLADRLSKEGEEVVITAEPTNHPEGRLLRRALAGEISASPAELAALFTADRIAHNTDPVNGLHRLLADGKLVLSDRYYYSTLAYQGALTDPDWAAALCLNCPEIRMPDLCIFLDLTPEESMARIRANRSQLEIFETEDQLARIRNSFFAVFDYLRASARGDRIAVIHADGSPEEVADRVAAAVASFL